MDIKEVKDLLCYYFQVILLDLITPDIINFRFAFLYINELSIDPNKIFIAYKYDDLPPEVDIDKGIFDEEYVYFLPPVLFIESIQQINELYIELEDMLEKREKLAANLVKFNEYQKRLTSLQDAADRDHSDFRILVMIHNASKADNNEVIDKLKRYQIKVDKYQYLIEDSFYSSEEILLDRIKLILRKMLNQKLLLEGFSYVEEDLNRCYETSRTP